MEKGLLKRAERGEISAMKKFENITDEEKADEVAYRLRIMYAQALKWFKLSAD